MRAGLLVVWIAVAAAPARAIIGAYHDAAPGELASVVFVGARPGFGHDRDSLVCGGALIAPRVVLTAAHCVFLPAKGRDYRKIPRAVVVRAGSDMTLGAVLAPEGDPRRPLQVASGVKEIRVIPGFTGELGLEQKDLALILLSNDAPESLRPLPIAGAAPAESKEVVVAGFGFTRPDLTGDSQIKHVGLSAVAAVGENEFRMAGQANICGGDSGSPVLVDAGGKPAVLGVVSHYLHQTCALDEGFASRLDAQRDWLDATLREWGQQAALAP